MSFLVIRLFLNVWHIAGTRVNRWGRRGRLSRVRLPLASLLFLFILFYKWEIRPSYWICFRFIFMLCSWVFCLHVCVPHAYLCTHRGQKRALDPLKLELRAALLVLGTQPGSSTRTTNALNPRAILQPLLVLFLNLRWSYWLLIICQGQTMVLGSVMAAKIKPTESVPLSDWSWNR